MAVTMVDVWVVRVVIKYLPMCMRVDVGVLTMSVLVVFVVDGLPTRSCFSPRPHVLHNRIISAKLYGGQGPV